MLIGSSFPHFKDLDGSPLNAGYIFFGQPNSNPETNSVTVYWDSAFTQPASQPIRTLNGYITRDGAIANLFAISNYSITVKNKVGTLLYSLSDSNYFDPSSTFNLVSIKTVDAISDLKLLSKTGVPFANVLGYYSKGDGGGGLYYLDSSDSASSDNGGTVIVATDGGRWKLSLTGEPSLKQFGAKGDGINDDTNFVINAKNAGCKYAEKGNFKITDFSIIQDIENWHGGNDANFVYLNNVLPVGPVTAWMELKVPSVFPTLQEAINFCQAKEFKDAGFIQIKIADGTYSLTQIEPQLPNGSDRVEIIGNTAMPGNVVLNFDATNNKCGFLLQRGNGIYKIDGMTINGIGGWVSEGVWNSQCYGAGVMANYNSQVVVGANVRINKFYYGVASRYGSGVRCEPGVIVQYAGDCGFFAFAGTLDAQSCQAFHCAHTAEGLGFGFCAESGGFVDASNSTAAFNGQAGFYANGASMWAHSITSDHNSGDGILAINGGKIECNKTNANSNAYDNSGCGYRASGPGSYINRNSSYSSNNLAGGCVAEYGGVVDITASAATSNTGVGNKAQYGGGLFGDNAVANANTSHGFWCNVNSWARGSAWSSNTNGGYGYRADNLSYMQLPSSGGAGNTSGFDNPPLAGTPGNNGSYIEN